MQPPWRRRARGPTSGDAAPSRPSARSPWRIVWAGSAVQLLVSSLLMRSYGAYVVLLRAELGWSGTLLSAGFSLMRVETGMLGPLQGWLLDRFGPRAVMRVGSVVLGLGFVAFSQVRTPWAFLAAVATMAVGASLTGWLTVVVAIVRGLDRDRTRAIAAAKIGVAVGGLVVPLVVLAMQAVGWRATALASGVLVLVIGPLLGGQMEPAAGARPPASEAVAADGGAQHGGQAPASAFTARQAARTRAFWYISLGHTAAALVIASLNVHLIPHLTESLGYSLAEAGLVVSLLTAMQGVGVVVSGWLGDRLSKRLMLAACMAMHAAGLLLVTYAAGTSMVVGFAVIHGVAWGCRAPLIQALRADYFGAASFGAIAGWSAMLVMIGQTAGPIAAGIVFDLTGSYVPVFTALSVTVLSGSIMFLLATPPGAANPGRDG